MRVRCFFVWLIGLVVIPSMAQAYILPADAIMRSMADVRRGMRIQNVSLQLNADLPGYDHGIEEHWYMKQPERSRLVQQHDNNTYVWIDREWAHAEGPLVGKNIRVQAGGAISLLPALLFPNGSNLDEMTTRLMGLLVRYHIDSKLVTLGLMDDVMVYIIGAHSWEKDKPQLWIDKNMLVPVRYKINQLESRFLDYGQGPAGAVLPRIIEDYRDGVLVRRAEVNAAKFNQDLPEVLFVWPSNHN